MALVDAGKARLATRLDGLEGNPWLVLSNSLAATTAMWDAQMPLLTARYRVLRYDTRGHGDSEAVPGPYGFDDLVGDVVALLDHYGVARAAFMGLSLGGMTGLGLALAHPERVERLVCCDARADAPPPFLQSWDERMAVVRERGVDALVPGTLERWFTPAFFESNPDAVERTAAMVRRTSAQGYLGCAAALKGLDYLKDLGRIACPTLYLVGKEDAGAPPEAMRAMHAATPDSEFVVVDGAHVPTIENPNGFNRAVAGFLGITA